VEWQDLITEWLAAQHNLERMKTFINTRLAETWELKGQGAEQSELEKAVLEWTGVLPAGVLLLTAGVDVQDNRLEVTVKGWGLDDEQWVVDHRIFRGDPSVLKSTEEAVSPWEELEQYLRTDYEHASGTLLRVACTLVDSGGHHTKEVYEFTRRREMHRIYACKGSGGIGKPLVSTARRVGPRKTLLFGIGVDTAKERVYSILRSGKCHIFKNGEVSGEYFRQLTSEKLVTTVRNNETSMMWVKKYERNEALDCSVYALAAIDVLKPNFKALATLRFKQSIKAKLPAAPKEEEDLVPEKENSQPSTNEPKDEIRVVTAPSRKPMQLPKRRNWVNAWQ
jgi:phage terminase large subunit GpA-like protein